MFLVKILGLLLPVCTSRHAISHILYTSSFRSQYGTNNTTQNAA